MQSWMKSYQNCAIYVYEHISLIRKKALKHPTGTHCARVDEMKCRQTIDALMKISSHFELCICTDIKSPSCIGSLVKLWSCYFHNSIYSTLFYYVIINVDVIVFCIAVARLMLVSVKFTRSMHMQL